MNLSDEDLARIATIVDAVMAKRAAAKAVEPVGEVDIESLMAGAPIADQITDEELLYFATPHYDEILAKKDLMTTQRREDEATK